MGVDVLEIGGERERYALRKADDGFFEAEEKAVGMVGVGGLLGALVPWSKPALHLSLNERIPMTIPRTILKTMIRTLLMDGFGFS